MEYQIHPTNRKYIGFGENTEPEIFRQRYELHRRYWYKWSLIEGGIPDSYERLDRKKYQYGAIYEVPACLQESKFRYTNWEKLTGNRSRYLAALREDEKKYSVQSFHAVTCLVRSGLCLPKIWGPCVTADKQMETAEKEFASHSYSLFWQALENVAQALDEIACITWGISVKLRADYEECIHSLHKHNFPPYFFLEALPDNSYRFSRYEKLVRHGLSNYEFASIWEAIKTRNTIIVGFKNIEDAVQGMRKTLNEGFIDLQKQLESNARDQQRATQIQSLLIACGLKK